MRIKADDLINEIISSDSDQRVKILEKYSRTRVNNTALTVEEVLILFMKHVEKYKPEDIAKMLSRSRSDIYAALQRVKNKLLKAHETARFIEALSTAVSITVRKGESSDTTIRRIYAEADKLNVKIPIKSFELKEKLVEHGLLDEYGRIRMDADIIVLPGLGIYCAPHGRRNE